MLKVLNKYFSLLLLVVLASCSAESDISTSTPPLDVSVSLQKTPCYGTCPVYNFQALNDGRATLRVDRFAEDVLGKNLDHGDYSGTVEISDLELITTYAEESGYFDLLNKYDDPMVMDLPAAITTIDGHNVFNRFEGPDLEGLYILIEHTISKIDWQKN
jgi:hypothetical protein